MFDSPRLQRPVETLLVDRVGLIRLLQHSLSEFNERRRLVAGTPAEQETVARIKYWEEVLVWVRQQPGSDVIVMERTT